MTQVHHSIGKSKGPGLRCLLLTLVALVTAGPLFGQQIKPLSLLTQSDGTNVRLRWSVQEADVWIRANDVGYSIRRMTTHRNGNPVDTSAMIASRVTLVSDLRPLPAPQWPTDELSTTAREVLYSTSWNTEASQSAFKQAVAARAARDSRLFTAHLLADRDYATAARLALGYTDGTAQVGETYQYFVEINGSSASNVPLFSSAPGGRGIGAPALIAAEQVSGNPGDTTLVIHWNTTQVDHQYTTFDIYRSPAGANSFVKANPVPFLPVSTDADDGATAHYTDSPPGYGEYDYYVVGLTPFGLTGPPSEVVRLTARPGKMNVTVRMDSISVTETEVTLYWPSIPTTTPHAWATQRIYRAGKVDDRYELVATISPAARQWTDPAPDGTGYYSVELVDEYGHRYRTAPRFAQLIDMTPPATPAGFRGLDRGDGIVDLVWTANTESDLAGYRLFRAFARRAAFVPVNIDPLNWNGYTDDLRENIINDSIYYRLQAEDKRANASVKTPILAIARADILPPSNPLLLAVRPTPAGVALTWRYSQSDDVARHEVRRRAHGTREWVTLAAITPAQQADYRQPNFDVSGETNLVDRDPLDDRQYDYRMLAFDESGNASSSKIITIRPYQTGSRGEITQLNVAFDCATTTEVTTVSEVLYESMGDMVEFYRIEEYLDVEKKKAILIALEMNGLITSSDFEEWLALSDEAFFTRVKLLFQEHEPETKRSDCKVNLSWTYEMRPGLLHFQVLRSRRGSRLRPYKVLPVTGFFPSGAPTSGEHGFSFEDEDADAGVRYVYSVVGIYGDGGYADSAGAVTVLVE